ncbi:MAG: zinc ribbon domain-containing protein [Burkholderiaceae bacterium]|nr:zinc ribbon domain-containing protein [Burkholderiaceae bacterium]
MPIYAYKCESCGQSKDVLQKMSDTPLSVCPFCGKATFVKQVTAAGFQLKGSGWYATDFRGGSTAATAPAGEASDGKSDSAKADTKPASGSDNKPADAPVKKADSTPAAASSSGRGATD